MAVNFIGFYFESWSSWKGVWLVNIVCISDLHRSYNDIVVPAGDLLIVAGDIDCTNLFLFNDWLGTLDFKHIVVIAGNHDGNFWYAGKREVRAQLSNAIYLENSGVVLDGVSIWGSPTTPTFNDWFFMKDRGDDIARVWHNIPINLDILITHGPPLNILDANKYGEHCGCWDLHHEVSRIKPLYHVFGHIHSGHGIIKQGMTTFINASIMDEDYQAVNKPITFIL